MLSNTNKIILHQKLILNLRESIQSNGSRTTCPFLQVSGVQTIPKSRIFLVLCCELLGVAESNLEINITGYHIWIKTRKRIC